MSDTDTSKAATIRQMIDDAKIKIVDALNSPTSHTGKAADLQRLAGLEKGSFSNGDHGLPASRIMDRALQELKKEGKAVYLAGRWSKPVKDELARR